MRARLLLATYGLGALARRRVGAAELATALWAVVALVVTRRRLARQQFPVRAPKAPGRLSPVSPAVVEFSLRSLSATCLERSLVMQTWLHAQGRHVDVVLGVRALEGAMTAHAWLDGLEDSATTEAYREIRRVECPSV